MATTAAAAAAAVAAAAPAAPAPPEEEEEESNPMGKDRVLCVTPDDEMGFLLNLPPPCNVVLQPSTIGMSGKVPDSPFLKAFERFLGRKFILSI